MEQQTNGKPSDEWEPNRVKPRIIFKRSFAILFVRFRIGIFWFRSIALRRRQVESMVDFGMANGYKRIAMYVA